MTDDFWAVIKDQLKELESATSADDVIRILSPDRNPYGPDWDGMDGAAEGFFAGSGGDGRVTESLDEAGWTTVWFKAHYYWAMRAPNGDVITYIEGDIYRGNRG
ncbi:hypothetical protein ACH4YO_40665 [Streptomyces noursei]|uniref:hypothetical protein n=1 Tax=Streptomyces noursei TaxID=1971 RepID=UPI00081CF0AB|nr:hypothetical protein SNOUR_00065 [Streptomyces noursei ATCC 11455]ANZ21999.1 hypothetical protein SNOUR_43885 [Streptomyces noursei ATCC 11455]MCZ0996419.1 hypothetical protein [Streptomyces noursei]